MLAAFSSDDAALAWAQQTAAGSWGPVALVSEKFDFRETKYYEATMGAGLHKMFLAFQQLVDPARLVEFKLTTNRWEEEYGRQSGWPVPRPLNLDPGYLTEAKLVLATTKDRDHRLYLDRGIYAEGTLYYHAGRWQARPWTYPDYRRDDYHEFFVGCREYLKTGLRAAAARATAVAREPKLPPDVEKNSESFGK